MASAEIGSIAASMSSTFVSSSFQVGAHALTGGAMSAAQGGNFWSGVRQGAITSGLNHLAHGFQERIRKNRYIKGMERTYQETWENSFKKRQPL